LVPLFAIELVDDMIGAVSGPASGDDADGILQSGEVWVYEANGTAEAGRYENLATVNATFSTAVVNESDRSHYNGTEEIAAMIEIEKRINGELGEEPSAPVEVEVGSSVVYTLNVTNTGDAPLSNVSVTDEDLGVELDAPSSGDDGNGILDPGEMWVYHLDPVEAIPGLRDNTATVTAEDPGGNLVSASATAYYQSRPADGGAAIELEVQVADETNPAPPGPEVPVGEPVSLFFYVTNTGEVPLTNVALTADGFATSGTGEGDDENDLLDAGETWGYETSIEALEGEQQIVAAVTAEDLEGAEVNGSATGYYVGLPSGEAELSLDVEIESLAGISNPEGTDTPPGPEVPAGQPIRLIFYAMNTGSVPWSDPLLRSDGFEAGSSPDGFDIDAGYTFGPGEGCSFEESATTREGEQRVTTTVTAQDPDGNPVSGSVIFYYTGVVEEETPEEEMTPEEEETPTEEETPEDENEEAVDQIDGEMVEA
ncbi:MAG: hypothetical protein QCH35_06695, partial [Methanomicrobiaceae archaeon]|nr:hypothetical protein [Methanomicrobiaceae archaeon]